MIVVRGKHQEFLNELLRRASTEVTTYSELGQTRSDALPIGYTHDRVCLDVGEGPADWNRAQDAIRTWQAHRHAGLNITPAGAALEEGHTVVVSRGVGPALIAAPCRIVYVTSSDERFGFAYGTLPGHPERGEEAFHVLQRQDGTVAVEIVVFSVHADPPASPVRQRD